VHESVIPNIHADMRHLPLNPEEQDIAGLNFIAIDCSCRVPKLGGGPWYSFAGSLVGIVNQATAIEPRWRAATVTIRHTDLVNGNRGGLMSNAG